MSEPENVTKQDSPKVRLAGAAHSSMPGYLVKASSEADACKMMRGLFQNLVDCFHCSLEQEPKRGLSAAQVGVEMAQTLKELQNMANTHYQVVLKGVLGKRWRLREEWKAE